MKKFNYFTFGIILIFLFSCSPVYVPPTKSTPILKKKKDVALGINSGTNGVSGHFALAPTKDVGVLVSGHYLNEKDKRSLSNNIKTVYGEMAFGKYYYKNNLSFASFFGMGHGWSSSKKLFTFNDKTETVRGIYNQYFFNSNLAFSSDFLDFGLSGRITYIDFYKYIDESSNTTLNFNNRSSFFFEPTFFGRFGHGLIKFELQTGVTSPITKKPKFDYRPFYFSVGIHLDFGAVDFENQ